MKKIWIRIICLCVLLSSRGEAQTYNWTIIAGLANTPSYADGTNGAAFFNSPQGVAVDGAGNVFVVDSGNRVIRKISMVGSNWITTTIAGLAGTSAYTDGVGNAARFYSPTSIQVDGMGNLYVQDSNPNAPYYGAFFIRKISPVGNTWVVNSIYKLDGSACGWAVDVGGNYYTSSNSAIIQLAPVIVNGVAALTNFTLSVVAGFPGISGSADGTNIVARFTSPTVFSVDSSGTIFLFENSSSKIRTVSPVSGNYVTRTITAQAPSMSFNSLDNAGNVLSSPWGFYDNLNGIFAFHSHILFLQAGSTTLSVFGGLTNATTFAGVVAGSDGAVYVVDNGGAVIRQGVAAVPVGSLQVSLEPNDALSAGAMWRVDAGIWQTNGATVTNLMVGSNHTLTFAPVYGWAAPSNRWVTISNNSTTFVEGAYIQQYGSLQVNLTPSGATNAGAQWQLDAGEWQNSGTIISNLTVGTHTVAFTNVVGFITPATQTNVNIVPNQTALVTGAYVALGAVKVNINPAGAVTAGAQWQLDGGDLQGAGILVSNVVPGSHTISFAPVTGWITPSNQTVTVNSGQTNTLTASYVVLGSMQVTINPLGAVNAGAQWTLDGGAWQNSGTIISNLTTGPHTNSYAPAMGYITPSNQVVNVNPGGTTNLSVTYVALGAVSVSINPSNAVNAGAQWSLDGGGFQSSGVIVSNVSLGSHTISFLPTIGYITPSNQTFTVFSGQTTNLNATYVALGNVQVTINPTNAIASGALWALDGGAWQNSGVLLSNLSLGAHTISYLPLNSWIAPSNQIVSLAAGQTTNVTATYTALGSLQVMINPLGAVSAGARWQVDSNGWQTSGAIVTNLTAGNHTVIFTNIPGWTTPASQTVVVGLSQTTIATGIYVQQIGNLQVVLSPAGAVSSGAQWQVDGGAWQTSGTTVTNITVGSHAIGYASIAGWTAPTNQTVTVSSNQTTRLTAVYQGQGSLQVMILPASAIAAGALWQVDGGTWMGNGAVVSGLSRGTHTVSYKAASGWVAPANQLVSILANQTTLTNAFYTGLGYSFVTIAGSVGNSAYADGTNISVVFDTPVGVCVDVNTNLYIADTGNSVIRKLTPTTNGWVSSTLAGLAGFPGNADGTNSQARFDYPSGVTVDTNGNLFVADQVNSTVRKLTTDGTNWTVTTIAGLAGNYGSANGTNTVARFYYPAGLTVDGAGNIYVADQINSTIRKLTPITSNNWAVTTIAGSAGLSGSTDGTNNNSRFYWPSGLTVDASGNLFVVDTFNNTLRKVSPVGANYVTTTISGVAGVSGSVDGTNNTALFDGPGGIALDSLGNLFVADSYSSTIRKITPVGVNYVVNTIGGLAYAVGAVDGTNSAARFNTPYGLCIDASGGIFVADTYNQTIRAGFSIAPPTVKPSMVVVAPPGKNFAFNWIAVAGTMYQIEFTTNLQTAWSSIGSAILATNIMMPFTDTSATNAQRFYRVRVLP